MDGSFDDPFALVRARMTNRHLNLLIDLVLS